MTDFLKWAFRRVVEHGKPNVLCLVPDHLSQCSKAGVQSFADSGLVNLGTTPFWLLRGEELETCIAEKGSIVTSAAGDCGIESHIWIQGFKVPSGREPEITQAVISAARLAPEIIAIWGFEGCAAMSSLACERPDMAWRCFLKGMHSVRG
jgi:hypothetical protein